MAERALKDPIPAGLAPHPHNHLTCIASWHAVANVAAIGAGQSVQQPQSEI